MVMSMNIGKGYAKGPISMVMSSKISQDYLFHMDSEHKISEAKDHQLPSYGHR